MLARILFGLLTIISLAWIVGGSIIQHQQTKQFQIEEIFGPDDKKMIIINQFNAKEIINEIDPGKIEWSIFSEDAHDKISKIYYSEQQNHALIQTNEIVTEKTLAKLFQKEVTITKNTFVVADYKGHFNHTNIYIHTKNIKPNTNSWALPTLDKNATANIITFEKNSVLITDFYNRKIGQFVFESAESRQKNVNPVNDKELFMHVVSNQISDYNFYKKENLKEYDPSLATQSWIDLCESGIVITKLNNQNGVYFDAKPNTTIHQLASSQVNTNEQIIIFQTTTESPLFNNRKSLYIANLDDHYVVSASKVFCEEALAHYKLGTVLQTNPSKMTYIFGNLPRKVHIRVISNEKQEAIRYVKGQKLTFSRKKNETVKEQVTTAKDDKNSPKHFNIGGEVKTAITDNSGRIVILNTDHSLHYFGLNGKILSLNNLTDLVQPIRFIFALGGEQFLPVIQRNRATLYTPTGTIAFQLEPTGNYYYSTIPEFLKVKGKEYLIIGASDGTIYWHNTRTGKVERQTKISNHHPVNTIKTWTSAGKTMIGAQANTAYYILNAETNKQIRNYTVENIIASKDVNGELRNIVFDKNKVKIINQKGGIINLPKLDGMTQVQAVDKAQTTFIAFDGKNRFVAFTASGELLLDRTLKDLTIDQFDATLGSNNTIIIACLDEINNNIQIINLTTEQYLNTDEIKGSNKVIIQAQGKNVFLYTFIDNILIRYDQ